jgi:hypothetical protein
VQVEVHDAQAGGVGHQLPAAHEALAQVLLLIGIECLAMLADHEVVGTQEEAARATGRVADGVVRVGLHHIDDGADQLPRREILAGALGRLLGALGQEALVDVALHIGLQRQPLLLVDQVHDQAAQQGRVLDLGLGLLEDGSKHP